MTLTVLHAPLHAPSARRHPVIVAREIRRHRPTIVGLSEAYGILPALSRMGGYRLVVESGGRDRRRGQKDNPVLVATHLRSLGSGQLFGCDASTPVKIAPERWFTFAVFEAPDVGAVCHITLHPHPVVQDRPSGKLRTDSDRARAFGRQMDVFAALLAFAKTMRWAIVVTGDLNFRDVGDDPRSPYTLLRRESLAVTSRNLDCIAFSPVLGLEVREVAVPSAITDHPWLLAVTPSS